MIISYRICANPTMYTCILAACRVSSMYVIHRVLPDLQAVLHNHVKLVIMYRICKYVCMHIGRIRLSSVHTIHVHSIAMCDLYPY